MRDDVRLSEITGIANQEEDLRSFWPVNLALTTLGGAVIALAFYFLDDTDTRFVYNPWTYAVATPVALLTLSAVLSTFVSRVVEKSMQFAFLLSVLIHILLLVYAVNIVIFSRMWPEVLESLAKQQHQLELESLQAKQYFRFSDSSADRQRPDYLRHVPTVHQPTELAQAATPALQLARNEQANLVSPTPELTASATAHIIRRSQSQSSAQATSPQLASLARSEASLTPPDAQMLNIPQATMESQPESLQPNDSASPSRAARAAPPTLELPSQPNSAIESPPQISRRSSAAPSLPDIQPSPTPPERRQPSLAELQMQSSSPITSPQVPSESTVATPSAAGADLNARRSPPPQALAGIPLPSPAVSVSPQAATPNLARAESSPSVADSSESTGQEPSPLPRSTAGGISGLPSTISLPVQGPQQYAANEQLSQQPRSFEAIRRESPLARASSAQTLGDQPPQSPEWLGEATFGTNTAGSAPQFSRNDRGSAASPDVANLTGASRNIERATIGDSSGSAPIPSAPIEAAGGPSGAGITAADAPPAVDARGDQLARRPSQQPGLPDALVSSPPETINVPSPALVRSQASKPAGASIPTAPAQPTTPMERAEIQPDAGTSVAIDIPSVAGGSSAATDSTQQPVPLEDSVTRTSSDRPSSIALVIDGPAGPAGVAPTPNQTGPIIARRDTRQTINTLPQLDAQRFSRRDIGGQLAAGQRYAVPMPAFQQRIDRLQERQQLDQSSISPQTELAIERGLAFLQRTQRTDGAWRLQDYDTKVLMRSDTAATGLALLAFQGAGYTHQRFKYANTVRNGLAFLIENQQSNGDLYIKQNPASDQNAWLYSHGIAALALCEAYGMSQDPELREPAQKALNFVVASQDPNRGGWRYYPGVDSDTSVTGWFLMALKSGQLAGLDIPPSCFERLDRYLDASQAGEDQSHLYRYNPNAADTPQQRHGLKPTAVMTSVGLLMRLYTGWDRELPSMKAGGDYLLLHPPTHGTVERSQHDTYYWYYATQVMFHMRGQHWETWHDKLYPLLIDHQVTTGIYAGSWAPNSPTPDLWARYGGRLYVTTMNLLSLEVSYRHLPLYEAAAK